MKIYDISQPVFSCEVYPGDDAPVKKEDLRMSNGATYNLTSFSMCAHNGTHVDAPFHFINDGKTVDELELDHLIGYCTVVRVEGELSANDAERIIALTKEKNEDSAQKILLKGDSVVTAEAAEVFASQGVDLIGVESQSVGPFDAPAEVHRILLSADVVLLEGIRLGAVDEGVYFLFAAPISLDGSDGAPVRAVLIDFA